MGNPITQKQLAMLQKIAAGEDAKAGITGRTQLGAYYAVRTSLDRRGWTSHGRVTEAGEMELLKAESVRV